MKAQGSGDGVERRRVGGNEIRGRKSVKNGAWERGREKRKEKKE